MEIASKYDFGKSEENWYAHWMEQGFFKSLPDDREPYTIVIPPPNVTGVLHMGHMLNNTIQDVLIRKARMEGKNACWVPGTDHASIATEAKVVAKLKEEGIDKNDLTREEFLKHAWEWTHKHGGIILEQLKKLGASCDWDRTKFTMDEDLSEAVIQMFIDFHKKGLIYQGVRMVNWDPVALTALSDEEVIHREKQSKLFYMRYNIAGEDKQVIIATTRPETILGDTAICVNPNDTRYDWLKGKKAIIPLVGREVPIIFDEYVDMEFGTGVLKITPAHDVNDYSLGMKHKLESIDIFNDDATINEVAKMYVGEDRFKVRKKIVVDLEAAGHIEKIEEYTNSVGHSERTDAVIEPRLSKQWFCSMQELVKPAIKAVKGGEVKLHPEKFSKTYFHWMDNIQNWCISRQLWWGHRIPVYYLPNGEYVVAKSIEDAAGQAKELGFNSAELKQDEDVLDTWFSSALWPLSVFDGIRNPDNEEINYYYPTNDIVTAPEILFFWVARMVITGYEYRDAKPFENVYLTGIVRDEQRRKMSKSLGNSPDPIELMGKYSADGVRVGMLLCSPAGNDLMFDEKLCLQGSKFQNKIWNAFKLIKGWEIDESLDQPETSTIAINWFESKFSVELEKINACYGQYKLSEVLMISYKLIWDDFCSNYLEMIKPEYLKPIDRVSYDATVKNLELILKVIHPFMPFVTEEIWHLISDKPKNDCIMIAEWPTVSNIDQSSIKKMEIALDVIGGIRNIRKQKNIAVKGKLDLKIKKDDSIDATCDALIIKMCNLESIEVVDDKMEGVPSFMTDATQYYIDFKEEVNVEEKAEELKKELLYFQGFLKGIDKKLSNSRFVDNAPEQVISVEKKKQQDTVTKIKLIEEQLSSIS
ncbi:MAG: valine--tRNA ligase [Flavobacteriales bacterium]|nr:valine--tRNA ligase [Flavobacteriales bacterium]